MSYEATIKTSKYSTVNIESDDGEVWMFVHSRSAHITLGRITPKIARELASALLDAAADLEPEVVGGTVDLRAEPVGVTA